MRTRRSRAGSLSVGLVAVTLTLASGQVAAAASPPAGHDTTSETPQQTRLSKTEYGVGWFEAPGADLEKGPNWYAKGLSLNAQGYNKEINFERSQDPADALAVISSAPGPNEIGQIKVVNIIGGQDESFCLTDTGLGGDGDYLRIVTQVCSAGSAKQRWHVSGDGEMRNEASGRYVQYFTNAYTGAPFLGPKTNDTNTVLIGGKYRWNAETPRESFTADAVFDADVTKPARVSGEATVAGSTVRVLDGTQQLGADITPVEGRWSLDLPTTLGMGSHTLTIQRMVDGTVAESLTALADYGNAVSIDTGRTGTGEVTLTGDGADGAALTLTVEGRTYTPTVSNGRWTMPVAVTSPTEQAVTVVQHARGNVSTTDTGTINAGLEPVVPITPVAVTSPQKDGTYIPGGNVLEGRGTPGAVISAENVGPNGDWHVSMGSTKVTATGSWALPERTWGPTNVYVIRVTQTPTDGSPDATQFVSSPSTADNQPVAVSSIGDGETYRPGDNTLGGTGTKGAVVSAKNIGPAGTWNVSMGSALVDSTTGRWALPARSWGPTSDYWIRVTQTNPDGSGSVTDVHVLAPTFKPLVLVTPQVGDTNPGGVTTRFAGTTTPFGTVTVRSAQSDAVYRVVEADKNGDWSFTRAWSADHEYHLIVQSEAPAGDDVLPEFVWGPGSAR